MYCRITVSQIHFVTFIRILVSCCEIFQSKHLISCHLSHCKIIILFENIVVHEYEPLESTMVCLRPKNALQCWPLDSILKCPPLHGKSLWCPPLHGPSLQCPPLQGPFPKSPRFQSAPKSLRFQSAPKSPHFQSAPKSPRFQSVPQKAALPERPQVSAPILILPSITFKHYIILDPLLQSRLNVKTLPK